VIKLLPPFELNHFYCKSNNDELVLGGEELDIQRCGKDSRETATPHWEP